MLAADARAGLLPAGHIHRDEEILFYPTFGWLDDTRTTWTVEVHACVFEPEPDSKWRKAFVHEVAATTGLDKLTTTESLTLDKRLRLFLVDHERNQRIRLNLAGREMAMGKTGRNGHAMLLAQFAAADVKDNADCLKWITAKAILPHGQTRNFEARIQLIPPTGISVISDIDDTIKHTEVLNRKRMLANTFWLPAQPVAGMADLYRSLGKSGAAFHYISGSPWQLYEPLGEFIATHGFPAGSMRFRDFRVTDHNLIELLAGDVSSYKTKQIEEVLKRFPRRTFILVGDSGEKDPEIYGAIARKHPRQIGFIFIRKVEGSNLSDARFQRAMRGIANDRVVLFRDPAECRDRVAILEN
ncbi:DUF2183 domain-containing protein [bacterium]|nr:DUF2183 domain-containing protein [bacterium]